MPARKNVFTLKINRLLEGQNKARVKKEQAQHLKLEQEKIKVKEVDEEWMESCKMGLDPQSAHNNVGMDGFGEDPWSDEDLVEESVEYSVDQPMPMPQGRFCGIQ